MPIIISSQVRDKLLHKIPPVRDYEIEECFQNRRRRTLIDKRRQHKTQPATRWFIARTNTGRRLKIVFITNANGDHIIKTAYKPNFTEERLYEEKTKG